MTPPAAASAAGGSAFGPRGPSDHTSPEAERSIPAVSGLALVILARPPRPGRAKTRLIPALGPDGAATFAAAALEDLLERFAAVPLRERVLAYAEAPSETERRCAESRGYTVFMQGTGDLGARMADLARRVALPLAFIGTDAPTLAGSVLAEVEARLAAGADAVFQPALDGGYTLGAFGRAPEPWLEGIPWSTCEVLERTLRAGRAAGLRTELLAPSFDVDDALGLAILCAHLPLLRGTRGWPARTAAFLETHGLLNHPSPLNPDLPDSPSDA